MYFSHQAGYRPAGSFEGPARGYMPYDDGGVYPPYGYPQDRAFHPYPYAPMAPRGIGYGAPTPGPTWAAHAPSSGASTAGGDGSQDASFVAHLTHADLAQEFAWVPGALRDAANSIESGNEVDRLRSEGRVRGVIGYLKGSLRALGFDASLEISGESRGVSVSVTYTRAALLELAESVERVLEHSGSRGFEGGCTVTFGRGVSAMMRGMSVSCGGTWKF